MIYIKFARISIEYIYTHMTRLDELIDVTTNTVDGLTMTELEHIDFRTKRAKLLCSKIGVTASDLKKEIRIWIKQQHKKQADMQQDEVEKELEQTTPKQQDGDDRLRQLEIQPCLKRCLLKWFYTMMKQRKGRCYLNPCLSNNQEDPFTMEPLCAIPLPYFISFKDEGFYYTFDIRGFSPTVNRDYINPYTRKPIEDPNILKIIQSLDRLQIHHIPIEFEYERTLRSRVVDLFSTMDAMNNYTDVKWFLDLNVKRLQTLYITLEDIWNYRASLTNEQKQRIAPNQIMFQYRPYEIERIMDLKTLQELILHEMEKMVTSAIAIEDRKLGCFYVIIGLCSVSSSASQAYPWLTMM